MENILMFTKIASDLEKAIEEGKLGIGDKLPSERKLAKEYKVSRNVVREALTILREKGLIVIKPGKGAYIISYSENKLTESLKRVVQKYDSSLEEMLEVREDLETLVISKAVMKAETNNIEELIQICKKMDKNTDINYFLKWDLEFHKALAKSTQNPILYILIGSFFDMTEHSPFLLTKYTVNYLEIITTAQKQHWELVNALKQRDRKKAMYLIEEHMKLFKKEIDFIQNKNSLIFPRKE